MASTPQELTVPAHIAARIAARASGAAAASSVLSAVVTAGEYSYPKISVRAGRFRLVEDGVETPVGITLDVVIVGANPRVSKVFYAKQYDDNASGVRPDCYSDDGLRPHSSVADPISTNCSTCPHNVLGSKITPSGAKSKLCGDQRHLAVVPAADPSKVYGLTIAVSAMKNLREYFKELQNFGAVPEEVVTELGFDDKASYPKVTFRRKGYVPAKALSRVDEILQSDEVKVAVRLLASAEAAPALAVPETKPAAIAAPAEPVKPVEAVKPAKPVVTPVQATSDLESKLDALFAE